MRALKVALASVAQGDTRMRGRCVCAVCEVRNEQGRLMPGASLCHNVLHHRRNAQLMSQDVIMSLTAPACAQVLRVG